MRTTRWLGSVLGTAAAAAIIVSCGGTGGGGGSKGQPNQQFVLNSNNSGRLTLNVSPNEVDANKSDRLGLTALLTDVQGRGVSGVVVTFISDVDDINASTPGDVRFIPNQVDDFGRNFGLAVTDSNGRADIIAVAGSNPTGTGDIIGTGVFIAEPPSPFGLRAQIPFTLFDVGFIDTVDGSLDVIPPSVALVEPVPGQVVFFNIVGGTPPYLLKNEVNGIGSAVISQHCLPGCTENGGTLCIGSPCQSDGDCNLNGSSTPANVCAGPIKRCLASCRGTNCAGSRCQTDADCNDGSTSPADVCKDSGQSIAFIINDNPLDGTQNFIVEDSIAASINVEITASFICGNGVARGNEQCDLDSINDSVCASFGLPPGCNKEQVGVGFCLGLGITIPTSTTVDCNECQLDLSCEGTGGGSGPTATPGAGATFTPGGGAVTPTPTPTPGAGTPTVSGTPGPGVPSNLNLALLANGSGDNGNGTLTTVIAATVTDSNGNQVPDGTAVLFGISGATQGAIVSSPSSTNADPPCDVANFQSDTGQTVLNQPGVAHTCVTYPVGSAGNGITITGVSGAASDSQSFNLPIPPP